MSLVVPAVLPSSYKDLVEKLGIFASIPSVSRIQIDIVDGRFVSPATWPYNAPREFQEQVKRGDMLPALDRIAYEIDLMCLDVEQAVEAWAALGATRFTIHAESVAHLPQLLLSLRKRHGTGDGFASGLVSFGLALNVASDLALIETCLSEIEYVQCMGIARIGRQGQLFDERVFEKIRVFRSRHPEFPMQIDGGVSLEVARKLVGLGVSNLVVGSALLRAPNPAVAFAEFEALKSPFCV